MHLSNWYLIVLKHKGMHTCKAHLILMIHLTMLLPHQCLHPVSFDTIWTVNSFVSLNLFSKLFAEPFSLLHGLKLSILWQCCIGWLGLSHNVLRNAMESDSKQRRKQISSCWSGSHLLAQSPKFWSKVQQRRSTMNWSSNRLPHAQPIQPHNVPKRFALTLRCGFLYGVFKDLCTFGWRME